MKNLTLSIFAGIVLTLTSCTEPYYDGLNVNELQDACECSDAVKTVSNIVVDELEKYDNNMSRLERNTESKKLVRTGKEKIDDIITTCQDKLHIRKAEIEKCPSYEEADKNMKIIKEL